MNPRMMVRGIKNTIALMGLALVSSTIIGILFGIISALRPYSLLDYVLTALAFTGVAMPSFFSSSADSERSCEL